MILTEEQAKMKMCHKWSVIHIEGFLKETVERECIASRCMAWRWGNDSKRKIDPTENGYTKWIDTRREEWEGYCGLGGKP
jgi:hypothetical protein